jgi:hypothetical protein
LDKFYGKTENQRRYFDIDLVEWFSSCKDYSPAGVFEVLIRYHANLTQPGLSGKRCWGLKTHSYVDSIPLLKTHFSRAKFIHIIRDPRDVALSLNKFCLKKYKSVLDEKEVDEIWDFIRKDIGMKSLVLGTKTCCQLMLRAQQNIVDNDIDSLEVRYEQLINSPHGELKRICDFLNIQYSEKPFNIPNYLEPWGAAKGHGSILRHNFGKYRYEINSEVCLRIHRYCYNELERLGYRVEGHEKGRNFYRPVKTLYVCHDSISLMRASISTLGLKKAIRFLCAVLLIKMKSRMHREIH